MGYYGKQLEELAETINKSGAEIVVSGTPIEITRVLKVKMPVVHVNYELIERKGSLEKVIDGFLKK